MLHLLEQPVSVVGNAQSIFNNKHGRLIDRFQTIRFNRADIRDEECQGKRWDFLVSSEINTFEKYNQEAPKFHTVIFSPTRKEFEYKANKINFDATIVRLPLEQSIKLEHELSVPPSTGLQILYFLDSVGNQEVSMFGFDFKQTRTFYETRNKGQHDFEKEKILVNQLIAKNGWKIYN